MYYPPDGTGRDTYIIDDNGGTCTRFKQVNMIGGKHDFRDNLFLRDQKRNPFFTPKMDKRRDEKMPAMRTYNNWPSREAVMLGKKLYETQRASVDRLSPRKLDYVTDPVSALVDKNRAVNRARSTLKTT